MAYVKAVYIKVFAVRTLQYRTKQIEEGTFHRPTCKMDFIGLPIRVREVVFSHR